MPALAPVVRPPDFSSSFGSLMDDVVAAAAVADTVDEALEVDKGATWPWEVFGIAPRNSKGRTLTCLSSLQQLVSTPQHHFKDPAVPSQGVMIAPVVPCQIISTDPAKIPHIDV